MRPKILCRIVLVFVALLAFGQPATAHRKKSSRVGEAGAFAYYVLSLSWSPQYCAGGGDGRDPDQCGTQRHYGFVVHGLWPQYERGFPQSCSSQAQLEEHIVDDMLDLMPSRHLVHHEWEQHGTCSGLSPAAYFATVRQAHNEVNTPPIYRQLEAPKQATVAELERQFIAANPDLTPQSIAVLCNGAYLQEVRICLDTGLLPRPCGRDVRSRCNGTFTLRPMR